MRLICPACAAAYDVPDVAVGPAGRVVECGACGKRWRAFPPDADAPAVDAPAADPAPRHAVPRDAAVAPSPPLSDPLPPLPRGATLAPLGPGAGRGGSPRRAGGAFMAGFASVCAAALLALALYARGDAVAAAAPALAAPLARYAAWVDARRDDLRAAVDRMRAGRT